jgi:hypothetical protein
MPTEDEIMKSILDLSTLQARHDERIKSLEELVKDVKQIKFAAYVAVLGMAAEVLLRIWK